MVEEVRVIRNHARDMSIYSNNYLITSILLPHQVRVTRNHARDMSIYSNNYLITSILLPHQVRVTRNHARDVYDAAEFKVADMKSTVNAIQAGAMRSQAGAVLSQSLVDPLRHPRGVRDTKTAERALVGSGQHNPGPVQRVFDLKERGAAMLQQEQEKKVDEIMFAQITGGKPPRSIVRSAEAAITAEPSYSQYDSRSRSRSPSQRNAAGGRHVGGVLAEVFKPVEEELSQLGGSRLQRKGGSLLDEDKFQHKFKGWWA